MPLFGFLLEIAHVSYLFYQNVHKICGSKSIRPQIRPKMSKKKLYHNCTEERHHGTNPCFGPPGALFDRCDRWPSALASCDAASVRQPLESLEWTMGKPRPERRRQFSKAKATRSSPTLKMSTIWTRLIVSGHSKRWLPLHAYTYVSRYLSIPEEPDLIIPGHNVCGCNLYYNVPVPLPSFLLEHSLLLFMAFSSSKYATINALWGTVHQWHAICLLNPLQQPKTRLLN